MYQALATLTRRTLRSFWGEAALALLLAALVFSIFLGRYFNGDYVLDTGPDQTYALNPLFHYAATTLASSEYPYRAPSIFGGIPLYNTPQFSCLYPFYWLGNPPRTPLESALYMTRVTFLHLFIFLVNMYVFLRAFGLNRIPAFIGACLTAFNSAIYSYLVWANIAAPYGWLPLALAGIVLVLRDQRPWLGVVLGVAGATLLTLASPSQPLIHLVYIGGALTAWLLLIRIRQRQSVWRTLGHLTLMAGLTFLLSAPVLLPAINMMRGAIRWVGVGGGIVGKTPIPFAAFVYDGWSVAELARVVLPIEVHHEVGDVHLGILAALLGGLSLFSIRRQPALVVIWVLALYSLASCTATRLGLAYVNYRLPLLNMIREPGRHLLVCHICLCILAASGFQYLTERLVRDRGQGRFLLVPYFLLSLAAVWLLAWWNPCPYFPGISAAQVWLPALAFVAVAMAIRFRGPVRIPGILLLAAIAIWPAYRAEPHLAPIESAGCLEEENLARHDILRQLAALPDSSEYRFGFQDETHYQHWCMNCLYYDLRTNQGYLSPLPYRQFSDLGFIHTRPNAGRLFGIKYMLVKNGERVPPLRTKVREFDGYTLYAAGDAMPRWFLVNQVAGKYADPGQFFAQVETDRSYRSKVFTHEKDYDHVWSWLGNQTQPLQVKARELSRTENTLMVWCSINSPAMFVLNEYYSKAWQISVDGQNESPLQVNQVHTGVLLPAGRHVLRISYEPQRFVWLVWAQRGLLAAGLLGIGLVVVARRVTPDQPPDAVPVSGAPS